MKEPNKVRVVKVNLTEKEYDYWKQVCNGKDLGPNLRMHVVEKMQEAGKDGPASS